MAEIKNLEAQSVQVRAQKLMEAAFKAASAELTPRYKPNAETTFMLRYSRKDSEGNPSETPAEAHWRVALNVASVTALYMPGAEAETDLDVGREIDPMDVELPFRTIVWRYNSLIREGRRLKDFWAVVDNGVKAWLLQARRYYRMLAQLYAVPNSPTWTGAGTPLGQLAACFVLPIDDSLIAGEGSIMNTLTDAVAIQKTGGGNGFSFGRTRPKNSIVASSRGVASGPVGWLEMYHRVFLQIQQGGSRRGANMGVCPIWHPDVVSFIDSKLVEHEVSTFNISTAMTDEFMTAVENDLDFDLRFGDEVYETVKARELFYRVVKNAHFRGDPGVLFIDTANRYNPCPKYYYLETTNPCGEQWLGPYENCCLGSIAVNNFIRDGKVDWEQYRRVIETMTEFLDDVIDSNSYVDTVPQLEEAAQAGRRIGLGLMGLADAMILNGVRYGSEDGLDFSSQVTEFMRYHAMLVSIRRAKERGSFPRIKESIYDPDLLKEFGPGAEYHGTMVDGQTPFTGKLWQPPTPFVEHKLDLGRPSLNWDLVLRRIKQHGVRNSCQTTFAPTGTVASTAGVEGYGCEPIFALQYTRTVMQEEENIELQYMSELLANALRSEGFTEEQIDEITYKIGEQGGSCQQIEEIPEHLRRVFVIASDLTPSEHVLTQATLQAIIDNSISKTINLPFEATVEDVKQAYLQAYETGCKGITIYREGSRELEVLTKGGRDGSETPDWPVIKPLPLPSYIREPGKGLPTTQYGVPTPFGTLWVDVCETREEPGRPFHIITSIGKAGDDVSGPMEALGRTFSWALRLGGDVRYGAEQLIGIGGATREEVLRPGGLSASVPDALGKLLIAHMDEVDAARENRIMEDKPKTKHVRGRICPKCHRATLIFGEGCVQCSDSAGCGYNKCG
jgi:ribonucleoside-diphosphate reductase alpha chain